MTCKDLRQTNTTTFQQTCDKPCERTIQQTSQQTCERLRKIIKKCET